MIKIMMHQRGSLLQTGLVVWDEIKWEDDTEEGGEDSLLHQHVRGIVFTEAGQSLLDTVLTHDSTCLCLFYCFIYFVLSF